MYKVNEACARWVCLKHDTKLYLEDDGVLARQRESARKLACRRDLCRRIEGRSLRCPGTWVWRAQALGERQQPEHSAAPAMLVHIFTS